MTTANFAVQPASRPSFDRWGCDWAISLEHAYDIARRWGEDVVIWRCPHKGTETPCAAVKNPPGGLPTAPLPCRL
jgi:hypothetical protein